MASEPKGFLPKDGLSLADVLGRVEHDNDLPLRRRREIASSLRKLARMIGRPLERIPADPAWLRAQFTRLTAAKGGISEARFRNIKSDLSAAARIAGVTAARRLAPFTAEWRALMEAAPARIRWNLSRLGHYCSANDIMPETVDDTVAAALHQALVEEGLLRDPDQISRNVIRNWNVAVDTVRGWPQSRLSLPEPKRPPWTLRFSRFTESFQREVSQWEARLLNRNPLVADAPPCPLSPETVAHRMFQVRMMASALVRVGHPIERITSFAYLVELQNFRDGIGFLLERHGGPKEAIHNVAMGIKAVAKHFVKVPGDQLEELDGICRRLDLDVDEIRERNRERLLQFEDDDNLAALLHLPAQLVELAAKLDNRKPREAAQLVQIAVAIEILLFAAPRIGNLASLNLDEHLTWTRTREGEVLHIVIPRSEVKNKKPGHHELSGGSMELVRFYLDRYRPRLTEPGNPWIFPGRFGGHRDEGGFSMQIKKIIRRHTGLDVNAHLFRHLASKMHLRLHPGDHVTLAHTLNDALSTVMNTYANFEKPRSLRHYQDSVLQLRADLNVSRPVRKPRKGVQKLDVQAPDQPGWRRTRTSRAS